MGVLNRPEPTRAELLKLAATQTSTELPTAGRFFGMGVNASYEAYHRGEFPCRVLRLGRKLRVPTADLLQALGVSDLASEHIEPVGA